MSDLDALIAFLRALPPGTGVTGVDITQSCGTVKVTINVIGPWDPRHMPAPPTRSAHPTALPPTVPT